MPTKETQKLLLKKDIKFWLESAERVKSGSQFEEYCFKAAAHCAIRLKAL